nr:pyridoxal-dependent decarboxylase [Acidobacteriota bacterium]
MSDPKHSQRLSAANLGAEHERLGRAALRLIADYARALDSAPVCSAATPAELERLFDEPLPAAGQSAEEIFSRFERDLLPHAMNIPSPRYYGLFNPTPLPIAVWADALASAINQNGAAWRNSPSASVVEARVLRWLCELVGYPAESFGTLTSGGSEANLLGLKCARDRAAEGARERGLVSSAPGGPLVVYASDQCHYSFIKGVDIVGIGRDNLRKIESDARFHVRTDLLREAVRRDIEEGNIPVCVAGAAG